MSSGTLNLVLGVVAGLCVGAFLAGYTVGMRTERGSRADRGLVVFVALLTIALVGGTWPLAQKLGTAITIVAVLLDGAISHALLGGLIAGRRQRKGQSLWGVSTFVTFLTIAIILGFVNTKGREFLKIAEQLDLANGQGKIEPVANKDCPENLKSLYLAFSLYAQDYDALPPAEKWLDNEEIASKITKNEWMHCPSVSNRADEKFGYAYNNAVAGRALKGKKLNEMPDAATTPLLYDSSDLAKNAHDAETSLPKPGRHGGANNILYCDGTVKAVTPK